MSNEATKALLRDSLRILGGDPAPPMPAGLREACPPPPKPAPKMISITIEVSEADAAVVWADFSWQSRQQRDLTRVATQVFTDHAEECRATSTPSELAADLEAFRNAHAP